MQTDYDDEVGFEAARHLRDTARLGDDRPFFLTVSFTCPHDPWEVRRAHWDLYDGVDIGHPTVDVIPRDRADPHSIRLRDMYQADEDPLTPEQAATARRGYLAAVSELDQRIGELLEVLDRTGLATDTIVLFTADHGEMLGERGLWYKMSFFDGSARVPLMAAGPGIRPGRIEAPVSHLDLAPTIAALAGVEPAEAEFSGVSLEAALTRGEEPPRGGCRRVPGRRGDGAGADAAPRPIQVHPLRRRSRAAVRPGQGSAGAAQSGVGGHAAGRADGAARRGRQALGCDRHRAAGACQPAPTAARAARACHRRVHPMGPPAAARSIARVRARRGIGAPATASSYARAGGCPDRPSSRTASARPGTSVITQPTAGVAQHARPARGLVHRPHHQRALIRLPLIATHR